MHKQIKLLILTNSFFIFAVSLFAPLYAIYVEQISASLYHVGGIWGFYLICVGVLVYFISKFENKIKYADYFLILGFMFRSIGWCGYLFASSLIHLYLIQIFIALGESFSTPSYNFLFSKNLDRGKSGSEWGLNTSLNAFIIGFAAIAGSIIVQNYGFAPLFIIMITLSLVSTIFAVKYRKQLGAAKIF